MRWDGLRLDSGQRADGSHPGRWAGQPALFGRDAVARTFDTPGFRGMTFYEVHARSISCPCYDTGPAVTRSLL
ncbi:MAG: hypothetical protein ACLQDY_03805 [Streptosporangiaceae bacterium]